MLGSSLALFALAGCSGALEGGAESLSGEPLAIRISEAGHDATSAWATVVVDKYVYRATVTRASNTNDGLILTVVGGDAVLELHRTLGGATDDVEARWSSHDGMQLTSSYPVLAPVSSLDRAMVDVRSAKMSRFDLLRLDVVLPVAAVVAEQWEAASEPFAADAARLVRDYATAMAASLQAASGPAVSPGFEPEFIVPLSGPGVTGKCDISCAGDGTACNANCPNSAAACVCACRFTNATLGCAACHC
jgi:hypothetical protein